MAQKKQVHGRFTQKIDTTENWNKAVNFIPMPGEIIIYKDNDIVKEKIAPSYSSEFPEVPSDEEIQKYKTENNAVKRIFRSKQNFHLMP